MTDYGRLAFTGAGGLTIGGLVFDQVALVATAALIVVSGALLIRTCFRRGKSPADA